MYGSDSNCNETDPNVWSWSHAICDRDGSLSAQDNPTIAVAPSKDAGSTWSNVVGGVGVLTIDLGQSRTVDQLAVFQITDSDGKVTHVQLFVDPTNSNSWTSVFNETTVSEGTGALVGSEYFIVKDCEHDCISTNLPDLTFFLLSPNTI